MISWILTSSYLWKDTWKRWFEQPGSVLARALVTLIMVLLSVMLLVAMRVQVERLRAEVDKFGLDNMIILETITGNDLDNQVPEGRFRAIRQFGELLTVKKLLVSARDSDGKQVSVVSYNDYDLRGLLPYLKFGYDVFVLSKDHPQGIVKDFDLGGQQVRGVVLNPSDMVGNLLQGDTLFVPSDLAVEAERRGFTLVYYLERNKTAPEIGVLTKAVQNVISRDRYGRVDVQSASMLKDKLAKLEEQQKTMRLWMSFSLGGAVALIYGTLSVLEFRQSMYVNALLRSFGVSRLVLGVRTLLENILIVNAVGLGLITLLAKNYERILKATGVKMHGGLDASSYFWGEETLWVMAAANVGVLISCIPVFWAMRRQVGEVLD